MAEEQVLDPAVVQEMVAVVLGPARDLNQALQRLAEHPAEAMEALRQLEVNLAQLRVLLLSRARQR